MTEMGLVERIRLQRQIKRIQPDEGEVWPFEGGVGNRRAMQVVGTVAAPLLAGFAFALLVLVLPTLAPSTTTLRAGKAVATTTAGAFSGHPNVAAALLVVAGVLLIFATQAGFGMVFHDQKPSDLQEWAPQLFRPTLPSDSDSGSPSGFAPIRLGRRFYSGQARTYLYDEIRRANSWARALRWFYDGGIMALLWGVTFLVWPPGTEASSWRIVATAAAGAGAAIETLWSLVTLGADVWTLRAVARDRAITPVSPAEANNAAPGTAMSSEAQEGQQREADAVVLLDPSRKGLRSRAISGPDDPEQQRAAYAAEGAKVAAYSGDGEEQSDSDRDGNREEGDGERERETEGE